MADPNEFDRYLLDFAESGEEPKTEFDTTGAIKAGLEYGTITSQQALRLLTRLTLKRSPGYPGVALDNANQILAEFEEQIAATKAAATAAALDPNRPPEFAPFTPEFTGPYADALNAGASQFGSGLPGLSSSFPDWSLPETRQTALEEQRQLDPGGVFSRVLQALPGYGTFNPLVRSGLENRYADAFTRSRLAQLGSPGLGFEEFLGRGGFERGDPNVLRQQLLALQGLLGRPSDEDVGFQGAARTTFEDPKQILRAIMQPGLAAIAPSLRGAFVTSTGREFERFQARQPGANQGDLLNEFQRRGFF